METFDAITIRRAMKRFDPDHRLSGEEVDRLLTLTLLSPTAFNVQNWRFVVVRDPELRRQIREAAWNQPQVTEASLFVVFCADLQAWNRQPERYWPDVPAETRREWILAESEEGALAIARYHHFRHGSDFHILEGVAT